MYTKLQKLKDEEIVTLDRYIPESIISTNWAKWNEYDEILYEAVDGSFHLILDEDLLKNITEYMYENKLEGTYPGLHIEGKINMEYYPKPPDHIIVQYLKDNLKFYTIYDLEENEEKKAV